MNMLRHWHFGLVAMIAIGLLEFSGCSGRPTDDQLFQTANDSNIKRITSLYTVFQGLHQWHGPADESEFIAFVNSQSADRLKRLGIDPDNVDAAFVSERDGQRFKIRWGIECRPRENPKPLVFEALGVEGVYWVSFPGYLVKEVDKAEYDRLWSGEADEDVDAQNPPRRG
jgi:hypothetical protein